MASSISVPDHISYKDYLLDDIHSRFTFNLITEENIKIIIKNLNSKPSAGYDDMSSIILKKLLVEPVLAKPISLILNQSLTTGIFPSKLKLSKVVPIHEKDDVHFLKKLCMNKYIIILNKIVFFPKTNMDSVGTIQTELV